MSDALFGVELFSPWISFGEQGEILRLDVDRDVDEYGTDIEAPSIQSPACTLYVPYCYLCFLL
jgi:hypothetical protein